jgi:predicted DNA-binding transcriptional regulator YafY
VEAAVLGAQWVASRSDPALARAAQDLVAKIAATVPEHLRPMILDPASRTPSNFANMPDNLDMAQLRAAIHGGRKVDLTYADEQGRQSRRVVWPVAIGYRDTTRNLIAWCELRGDFRNFRTDRVVEAVFLEERYPERPPILRARWRRAMEAMFAKWREAPFRNQTHPDPLSERTEAEG